MYNRVLNTIATLGFLIVVGLPLLTLSPAQWTDRSENRESAAFPALPARLHDWLTFPAAFEAFFNDHFGERSILINFRRFIDFHVFGRSPTPLVLIGKHNWLFFTGDQSIPDYMGKADISDADLAIWYAALKQRRDWFRARGIDFHFVVTPNKQSVYPEFMPDFVVKGAVTRKDRLLAYLRAHGEPSLMEDLYPTIVSAKGGLLYHPLDTHWNPYGAYLGYRVLAQSIMLTNPADIHPIEIPKDQFAAQQTRFSDLTGMMKFDRGYPYSTTTANYIGPALTCGVPVSTPPLTTLNPHSQDSSFECNKVDTADRALIFHDSMIEAMRGYLTESFSHVRFVWVYPTFTDLQTYARAEHPRVVIEQVNERGLLSRPEPPPMAKASLSDANPPNIRGGVATVTEADGDVILNGFSNWRPDDPRADLQINTNLPVEDMVLELRDSPDVASARNDPRLRRSRFILRLYLRHDQPMPPMVRLCLWTDDPDLGAVRIALDGHADWDSCPGK